MKSFTLFLLLVLSSMLSAVERLGTAPAAHVATPPDANAEKARKSKWVFNLLPKSFQRDPFLEMTVYTEMTGAGRELTPPTKDRPEYYLSTSPGYHTEGGSVREHPPAPAELLAAMEKSLAAAGYLRATPEHPPTLLLIQHWGSHNRVEPEVAVINPEQALKNLFARARLVGGREFSRTLRRVYDEDMIADARELSFPRQLDMLRNRSPNLRFLIDQSHQDIYFVVASAYDYAATAQNEPRLLWRTTMTVNTQGVSMKQTLPPLIANATGFFGHEMKEAVAIQARGLPEGRVEAGEPVVLGVEDEAAPARPAASGPAHTSEPTRP